MILKSLRYEFTIKLQNNSRDFKQIFDPTYGNCYTFNWNRNATVTAYRAGANYGKKVKIKNLPLFARIKGYAICECIRVFIHNRSGWIPNYCA